MQHGAGRVAAREDEAGRVRRQIEDGVRYPADRPRGVVADAHDVARDLANRPAGGRGAASVRPAAGDGILVERQPDFLATLMWGNILLEELENNMHLVFDGVARSRQEAEMLTTALEFYRREKSAVIYLDVSRRWSEEKLLKRGRSDDINIEKIDKRLNWFDQDVTPAVEFFKNNPFYRFLEIDGEQSIERVHSDIIAAYDYSS